MTRVAVTLFSGLGSSSKALRDLGFEVIAHDFMPEAVETLRANGFIADKVDVRKIDYSWPIYRDVEVLVGGPPCQPFSQAHKGDGRYDERDMIPEFLRAIAEMLPRVFVMEEVKTLTWKKHADYLAMVEDHMRTIGYRVEHRVLDASDYGHAQARKRLFVIGVREDEDHDVRWPLTDVEIWNEKVAKTTMAEALDWDEEEAYARASAAPVFGDYQWVFEKPAPTVVGSFRPDVAAKPGWRKPGDGPRQNTPGSVVTTLKERLVLQDMPTYWIVKGSPAKQALQVGNSVPCGLIRDLVRYNLYREAS